MEIYRVRITETEWSQNQKAKETQGEVETQKETQRY